MERDDRHRDRQHEHLERSEQSKQLERSQEERSFVARSIEKCEERRGTTERSKDEGHDVREKQVREGLTDSARERDLTRSETTRTELNRSSSDRLERDVQVLRDARVTVGDREVSPFKQENWAKLSEDQRAEVFQKLEIQLSKDQGRPSVDVEKIRVADGAKRDWRHDEMARYDDGSKAITLRQDVLEKDAKTALMMYLHEARHAYQHDAMEHPWSKGDLREDAKTIKLWQDAKETYPRWKPATEKEVNRWNEQYEKNALEVDARKYSEGRLKAFYDDERQ